MSSALGFESGALKPSAVKTWPLDDAVKAYEAVAAGEPLQNIS